MRTAGRASILVNNFDYGDYVGAAIESALSQTWPDVEVVVVDDGSTDGSRAVLAGFEDRIVAVLKENGGQASAINAGFAQATGEVVLLLDADDWFLPSKVETVMGLLAGQRELGWCFHPLRYDGDRGSSPRGTPGVVDARPALRRGRPHGVVAPATSGLSFTSALLARILPMPEEMRIPLPGGARGTAADAYVKIAALGLAPGVVLDEDLAVQRLHGGNAYTENRRDDPRRAVLELQIACELRERWPDIRRYGFARGLGGLKQLQGRPRDAATATAVAAFLRTCSPMERARVAAHEISWRLGR